jgi:hypothetical protein
MCELKDLVNGVKYKRASWSGSEVLLEISAGYVTVKG